MIELPIAQVVVLALAFAGSVATVCKVLFSQFEKRMAERFRAHDDTLKRFLDEQVGAVKKVQDLEREFLTFRGDMPNLYVRREDYIRNQTIIEAKLDVISSRFETVLLKGHHQ